MGDSSSRFSAKPVSWIGQVCVITGALFIVLGVRLFVGDRFVALAPLPDDFETTVWLQAWKLGNHDWSYIFHRINGHPMELYYLCNLAQYCLNGVWDARLDFISMTIVHTLYAGAAFFVFLRLAQPGEKTWVLGLLLLLFMVPFAGYRVGWGLLWVHTAMIMFAILTIYAASGPLEKWSEVVLVVTLAFLASINNGGGCVAGVVAGGLVALRAFFNRRISSREIVVCVAGLVIFALAYQGRYGAPAQATLSEKISLFLKTLGWPIIFTPLAGFLTLVPLAGLAWAYLRQRELRNRQVEALLGIGGYLFLMAVGTGFLRGDFKMPSGRFTDILQLIPVVCALALSWLIRTQQGRAVHLWRAFTGVWLLALVFGLSLHFFYRTLPFVSGTNGEWVEGANLDRLRDISRGQNRPVYDFMFTTPLDHMTATYGTRWTTAQVTGKEPFPAMTVPSMAGFSIQDGNSGDFVPEGFPPAYAPRPQEHYMGSYDLDRIARENSNERHFRSGSFQPSLDYLTLDLLVDKFARFSAYRLDGVQLNLVDETSSQSRPLLPLLLNSYPSIFRDWELIYFPVIPGHIYHLEAQVSGMEDNRWLAFSEPRESGRLTPFIIGFSQSGKLFSLIGVMLMTLGVFLLKFYVEEQAGPLVRAK
jgi:hypothetical protein